MVRALFYTEDGGSNPSLATNELINKACCVGHINSGYVSVVFKTIIMVLYKKDREFLFSLCDAIPEDSNVKPWKGVRISTFSITADAKWDYVSDDRGLFGEPKSGRKNFLFWNPQITIWRMRNGNVQLHVKSPNGLEMAVFLHLERGKWDAKIEIQNIKRRHRWGKETYGNKVCRTYCSAQKFYVWRLAW